MIKYFIFVVSFLFSTMSFATTHQSLYKQLKLNEVITFEVFNKAMTKHEKTKSKVKRKNIISIIDFSKPSTEKRMVVIDLNKNKVLFKEYVSHGQKSGSIYAKKFSNKKDSHQTSLGQYKTAETYYGKHGYSLKLDGKEDSNSNARNRYIVIHGADYVNEAFIKKYGLLGRSWGCPALDKKVSKKIIDIVKGGTYLYAYN